MLRKMCKHCAPKGSDLYYSRKLTGEVTSIRKLDDPLETVVKTVTCSQCGHQWNFTNRHY